jgi:plasmid replication initiation protein
MSNENQSLVVKHNALINASYSLTLVEQRLILLAVVKLRQATHNSELDHLAFDKPIVIHVSDYVTMFGVTNSTAYETLKDACKNLFERRFSFVESRPKGSANVTTRWVSHIAYIDDTSTIEFTFAQKVYPLVTYLEKHFTSYDIEQVAPLKSGYAVRLYELVISWRIKAKTEKIAIQELRSKLGIEPNQYERMELFKRKVLDVAVKQINDNTDIILEYEQHKKGRQITHFTFSFKHKKKPIDSTSKGVERDPATADMFLEGFTDKQLARAVHSKKFIADYNDLVSSQNPANQSSGAWIAHMVEWLKKDPKNFTKRPMQEYLDDEQAQRF